ILSQIPFQHAARDDYLVHFVRTIVDARGALVAIPVRQQRLISQSERSVNLNRTIDNLLQNTRDEELDHRDIFPHFARAFRVDPGRGFQHEQPRGADLGPTFCDPLLHVLFARQQHARRQLAARGVAAHQIKRALADTDPTHAVMNSARPESLLRDREALAFPAQQIALRHAAVLVSDFRMTGVIAALVAHDADVSHYLKSRRGYRNDDLARTFVWIRVLRIGYGHHNGEASAFGRRSEPLVTVDDVIVTVFQSRRAHPSRIRSGMLGFSHGETTAHVATREWFEIFLFLIGRAMGQENFHVADVGRLAVEQI